MQTRILKSKIFANKNIVEKPHCLHNFASENQKLQNYEEVLFVVCCAFAFLNAKAQRGCVTLYGDQYTNEKPRSRDEIPIVRYDNDEVTVSSDSLIYNVTIVIKDEEGRVMHSTVTTVDKTGTNLFVPDEDDSRKYTIELVYDEKALYGYFGQ